MKNVIIYAATVEVCCPYCGAAQPNPDDGGFDWTPVEVSQAGAGLSREPAVRPCVECGEVIHIVAQNKVQISKVDV